MIKKGLAVAVILLFISVAFIPSINSNVVISNSDTLIEDKEVLYQKLMEPVREYANQVESSEEDCGCEDDNSENGRWRPIICAMLYPIWLVASAMAMWGGFFTFYVIMNDIGREFNCYFAGGSYK